MKAYRWAGLASIAIAVVAFGLWFNQHLHRLIENNPHTSSVLKDISVQSWKFQYLPSIGFVGAQPDMQIETMQISATRINIKFDLLSLLGNTPRISEVHLYQPIINLDQIPDSLSGLPEFQRLRLVDGQLWQGSKKIFERFLLDVRNIGPDQKNRWELFAEAEGGTVESHGESRFSRGNATSAHTRINVRNFPANLIPQLNNWLPDEKTDANLTITLHKERNWQMDGNITFHLEDAIEPTWNLRGKLLGNLNTPELSWNEVFLHYQDKGVITMSGRRNPDYQWTMDMQLKNIPLQALPIRTESMPFPDKAIINGSIAGKRFLHWQWDGDVSLRQLNWFDQTIRDATLTWAGYAPQVSLKSAILEMGDLGSLHIRDFQCSESSCGIRIEMNDLAELWVPIWNKTVKDWHLPALRGSGRITSFVDLDISTRTAKGWIDAEKAMFQIRNFTKPIDIPFTSAFEIRADDDTRITLNKWQLGSSSIQQAQLAKKKWELHGFHLKGSELDDTGLWKAVHLPAFQGHISGDTAQLGLSPNTDHWLDSLNGNFQLDSFGAEGNRFTGKVDVDDDSIRFDKVLWRNEAGDIATLDGTLRLPTFQGKIDLSDGQIDLNRMAMNTSFPEQMALKGNINHFNILTKIGETKEIKANYTINSGKISLLDATGVYARGKWSIPSASFWLNDGSLQFDVPRIHLSKARFEDMPAFLPIQRARIYATLGFQGNMDQLNRLNGDVDLFQGRLKDVWKGSHPVQQIEALSGIPSDKKKLNNFDLLRFRLDYTENGLNIKKLQFENNVLEFQGSGSFSENYLSLDGINTHLFNKEKTPLHIEGPINNLKILRSSK